MIERHEILKKAIDRLKKEIVYYKKELIKDDERIKDLTNQVPNEDTVYKIKNYRNVVRENEAALAHSETTLQKYETELKEIEELNKEEENTLVN